MDEEPRADIQADPRRPRLVQGPVYSSDRVVVAAILLTGFGAAHLIDDFLYDIPAELGLSNTAGQVLTVLYFVITSSLLVLAARGSQLDARGPT